MIEKNNVEFINICSMWMKIGEKGDYIIKDEIAIVFLFYNSRFIKVFFHIIYLYTHESK